MIRSKKELGQVLLDNQDLFNSGLCSWIHSIRFHKLITNEEFRLLNEIIHRNRPVYKPIKYSIYNPDRVLNNRSWYWESGYIRPRIKWIKKHLMK